MDWRLKAAIQKTLAWLPSALSYSAYYQLQRRFGALRRLNPCSQIEEACRIARAIRQQGRQIAGATVLEVGTGRRLNLPLTMWLLGAERVITVDLNRYLKFELIAEDLGYLVRNQRAVEEMLQEFEFDSTRFAELLQFDPTRQSLEELLQSARIEYLAPSDASQLQLPESSVDFQVSSNVFEHIPREVLVSILQEGSRVLSENGLQVHCIDHTDHFSHVDKSLSPIHFLRYGPRHWDWIAGNRYMYMNRLQSDDFRQIFQEGQHAVLAAEARIDEPLRCQLERSQLPLDARFVGKSPETLATLNSLFVCQPLKNAPSAIAGAAA